MTRKSPTNKSFTLIELLVAVTIFSFAVSAASGLLISGITHQRRVLIENSLLDEASYAVEYLSRAARMAKKDLTGTCVPAGYNYNTTASGFKFIHYNIKSGLNECWEIYRDAGTKQLMLSKNGGTAVALTSDNFEVSALNIALAGESQTDNYQPSITFFLSVKSKSLKPELQPIFQIQTTISQRNLDIQE